MAVQGQSHALLQGTAQAWELAMPQPGPRPMCEQKWVPKIGVPHYTPNTTLKPLKGTPKTGYPDFWKAPKCSLDTCRLADPSLHQAPVRAQSVLELGGALVLQCDTLNPKP